MARVRDAMAVAITIALVYGFMPAEILAQAPAPTAQKMPPAKSKKKAPPKATVPDAAKAADPAEIQKQIDAAQKSLDAGKHDTAIAQINAVMAQKGLETKAIARALAVRGQAYRRQGKPAQAIADLQSALHLRGGLSEAERAAATQARAEAYREAGLAEPHAIPSVPRAAAPGTPPASSPVRTGSNREPAAPAPSPPANNGIGDFLSGLFGSNGPKPSPPPPSAPPVVAAPAAPPPEPPPTTGAVKPPVKAAVVKTPPVTAKQPSVHAKAPVAGSIRLQLAGMRSQKEAQALAERVRKELGPALGGRSFDIAQMVYGNMGTFYHARFGPYGEQTEPTALCSALKAKKIDCQVMSQ